MQNAELMTLDELAAAITEPKVKTVFQDGYVTLTDGDYIEYDISLRRIRTPEELLAWAHHLTEKRWMDIESLRKFIEAVAKRQKFPKDLLLTPA